MPEKANEVEIPQDICWNLHANYQTYKKKNKWYACIHEEAEKM